MDRLTEAEAFVGVALCAVYSDGAIGADEDERLTEHLLDFRALQNCDETALRAAMQKTDAIARRDGETALLDHAREALRADLRPTAFFLGADLLLADGVLEAEERAFIDRLRRHLGVDEKVAAQIVEVVLIRNRG